jgi:hypothetical protein
MQIVLNQTEYYYCCHRNIILTLNLNVMLFPNT